MKITEYQIIEAIELLQKRIDELLILRLRFMYPYASHFESRGKIEAYKDCIKLLETLFKPQEIKEDEN